MTLSQIPIETYEETLKAMRQRCYRAIKSMDAQQGVTGKGFPRSWAVGDLVRKPSEAYGYDFAKVPKFKPSPKDLTDMMPVMAAIAQHKAGDLHGERDFRIIVCRAYDIPWRMIGDKLYAHGLARIAEPRTMRRWQDRAVEKIINQRLTQMVKSEQFRVIA